ncbi:MAG: pantoate--beta-alanine ligase [Candidatus Eisenbacteria bacterium]|nr:pantoate--beta-alanine ligase [Candidatus Eisenbacteria bacterium]
METLRTSSAMAARSRALRAEDRVVGFVPTMGALHEGHLSLIRIASALADVTVVSVFVNPTQFGPTEDFDRYPRDLECDAALAEAAGCDILFAPEPADVYPRGHATVVHVERMGERLCGAARPGHFDGVTTVVAKLLNVVRPSLAVFGQKDGQQLAIVERMVADLNMGVEIIRAPTVREADGLAMSSRNAYLSAEERREAPALYRALREAAALYEGGERDARAVVGAVRSLIESGSRAAVQYVSAVDAATLEDVAELRPGTMIAVAAHFGGTRLIDNIVLP